MLTEGGARSRNLELHLSDKKNKGIISLDKEQDTARQKRLSMNQNTKTLRFVMLLWKCPSISPPMSPILWGSISWEGYKCTFVDLRFAPGSAYVPRLQSQGPQGRRLPGMPRNPLLCKQERPEPRKRIDEWMETLPTGMYFWQLVGMLLLQFPLL